MDASETFGQFCEGAGCALANVVAGHEGDLASTAQQAAARWHPNGFVVFDLGAHLLGRLRLHVWPAESRRLRTDAAHVHSHAWDLCSRVLAGVYAERIYERSDDGTGERFHAADVDYAHDRDTLQPSGSVCLRSVAMVSAARGEVHTVQAGVVHETVLPDASFTATLLITSALRLDSVSVFSRTRFDRLAHTRPEVDDSLRRRLLEELTKELEDAR